MPYDHYLFDMPDMEDALTQINSQKEEIVGTFYLSDSSQVCIIVKREDERIEKTLKALFEKDED
jgi:hypothetical protein